MADEREGQKINEAPAARDGEVQSAGRRENAAQPLSTDEGANAGAERYPDAQETRSFEPKAPNETGPKAEIPRAANEGRLGPGGDPVEGKR